MRKLVTGWRPILALAFLATIAWAALRGMPDGKLHVWFLDVGQGDAILIQSPDGRQVLVDGGPSPSALNAELGEVLPFWDRSLDVVVMTHPDADHANGLIPLFDRFSVGAAVDATGPQTAAGAAWIAAAEAAGAPREVAERGMRLTAGAAQLTVLSPAQAATGETENNGSVVLRLDYGATSLLLTGDAELEAEQEMLAAGVPLRADALKVGHHGSNASTSAGFLAAVQPKLAVISVGADNRFGHPAPELLGRLAGIETLRTDQNGTIELVSDGKGWVARRER
jgi:competence protein ComEC